LTAHLIESCLINNNALKKLAGGQPNDKRSQNEGNEYQ